MISLVLKPVQGIFLVAWVKVNGVSMDDLQLVPTNRNHEITNPVLVREIKAAYDNFNQSNLSVEEYFQCNILIAKRYTGDFILQKIKFDYTKVWLYFEQIC